MSRTNRRDYGCAPLGRRRLEQPHGDFEAGSLASTMHSPRWWRRARIRGDFRVEAGRSRGQRSGLEHMDGQHTGWRCHLERIGAVVGSERGGAPYKGLLGYSFVYGDYFEIAVDGDDVNHIIWGAGGVLYRPGRQLVHARHSGARTRGNVPAPRGNDAAGGTRASTVGWILGRLTHAMTSAFPQACENRGFGPARGRAKRQWSQTGGS